MNPVFADLPVSIFETMSLEAKARGAVNLGQGFPETDGFPDVREAAARALMDQSNQYAPMRGLPVLRQAVADFYRRRQGLDRENPASPPRSASSRAGRRSSARR